MTIVEAFISGCIQGIAEFFPISSSGHLVLLHHLFGIDKPHVTFDVLLHVGTLCSIFIFFRTDIIKMFTTQKKLALTIIIGSIPTAIIGFIYKDTIEALFVKPRIVGFMFLLTALFLLLAAAREKFFPSTSARNTTGKTGKIPSFLAALVIGTVQGIAIIPGLSRSGATISTGILAGVEREMAVTFSFLLAIPAILGASLLKFSEPISENIELLPAAVGFLSAFMLGLASLKILRRAVIKSKLYIFALYCIGVGLFTIFRF
ncbi:MAG: undecaprenyl-diphosphate phosphatase [Candidatus Omnitrophota bacterium]